MAKRTLFVTGANGFLGKYAARHFSSLGFRVIGIGRKQPSESDCEYWGINCWYTIPLTPQLLKTIPEKPELIIHCAGSGSVGFSFSHTYEDYLNTVNTTAAVLEYIKTSQPEARLIYPSSAAVYGAIEPVPASEGRVPNPMSPYGVHKLIAEHLCRSYSRHFRLDITILRFFSLYGEYLKKQLIWDACGKISQGQLNFGGDGNETRDWLHVSDAVRLMEYTSQSKEHGIQIYNGGSGVGVATREILSDICDLLGTNRLPVFSGEGRTGDPVYLVADTTEALRLGWKPLTSWKEGLQKYISWYKTGRF